MFTGVNLKKLVSGSNSALSTLDRLFPIHSPQRARMPNTEHARSFLVRRAMPALVQQAAQIFQLNTSLCFYRFFNFGTGFA